MDFRYSILIIGISICVVYCQLDEVQQVLKTSNRKYCGSHLAQALSTICRGNYNTLYKMNPYTKRHAQFESSENTEDLFPFQKRADASLLSNYARRRKRGAGKGVYNECCEKSCSREELSSYCAATPYRRRR